MSKKRTGKRRMLKGGKRGRPLTAAQINQAENLRLLLLNHHNLTGGEANKFEAIVMKMDARELTNLSRQYRGILEEWKDSNGVGSAISQDVMKRIEALGNEKLSKAVQTVIMKEDRGTALNRKYAALYGTTDPAEIVQQEMLRELGYDPRARDIRREDLIKYGSTWKKVKKK